VDDRVHSGKVYLYGEVDDWYGKYHAGHIVETISSVIRIVNLLSYPERGISTKTIEQEKPLKTQAL